jgi:hypothetical protein
LPPELDEDTATLTGKAADVAMTLLVWVFDIRDFILSYGTKLSLEVFPKDRKSAN